MNPKEILSSMNTNPHYLNRYIKFIETTSINFDEKVKGVKYESHHICPESHFPQYKVLKKNPWNKSILTQRQHFIAHKLLAKALDTKQMWYAYWMMAKMGETKNKSRAFKVTSREYEYARGQFIENFTGENHPLYGTFASEETRSKMSKSQKGIKKPQVKVTCPHCNKTGGICGMKSYHFDNCKFKPGNETLKRTIRFNEVTCPRCNKIGKDNLMYRYHFDMCKTKPGNEHITKHKAESRPQKRVECPHCKKIGALNSMVRWHFDNCKTLSQ